MHTIRCIGDNIDIVRVGTRASIKRMIRSGAASQVLEVILWWNLARLRLGLGLVQASSKLGLGLSLARSQANYTPRFLSIYYNLSSSQFCKERDNSIHNMRGPD